MPSSIADYLQQDMVCEDVFECVSGSSELDREVYFALLEHGQMDVDEIADTVDRERSTAYRAVQRLKNHGFIKQEQVGQSGGGYRHVYTATPPEQVADQMQHALNELYAELGQLIHEFRETYADTEQVE